MTAATPAADPAVAVDVLLASRNELPSGIAPQVETLVGRAVSELGLPGVLRVRSVTADVPGNAMRVSVNGEQFLVGGLRRFRETEELAHLVASTLHAERSAWVTAASLDAIRAAIEPGAPVPDDMVLLAAARELARRGVAMSRLVAVVPALDNAGLSDPLILAERAMATTTARLSIRLVPLNSAVQVSRNALEQLPEEAWTQLGIVIPAVRVDDDPAISWGFSQVAVNDVGLPATKTTDIPASGAVAAAAGQAALQHAGSLLTMQVAEFLLDRVAGAFPLLVSAARARLSDEQITAALRGLLDQGVSVSDLRGTLEVLIETLHERQGDAPTDCDDLVAAARPRFGLMLVRRHLEDGVLSVLGYKGDQETSDGSLPESAVAGLHEDIASRNPRGGFVILAPAAHLVAPLRRALRPRFTAVLVVTADDIPAGISVRQDDTMLYDTAPGDWALPAPAVPRPLGSERRTQA